MQLHQIINRWLNREIKEHNRPFSDAPGALLEWTPKTYDRSEYGLDKPAKRSAVDDDPDNERWEPIF